MGKTFASSNALKTIPNGTGLQFTRLNSTVVTPTEL